jgi:hypothetical protein
MALSDWELWACANHQVKDYGRGALTKAGQRLLELEAAEDVEGHIIWTLILERIITLVREEPGPGERVQ